MKNTLIQFRGLICLISGAITIIICLVLFGISLSSLDAAYISSLGYNEQAGLSDIISMFGLVVYLLFLISGLAVVVAGTYLSVKDLNEGDVTNKIITFISSAVSIILAIIMNSIILAQLHSLYI